MVCAVPGVGLRLLESRSFLYYKVQIIQKVHVPDIDCKKVFILEHVGQLQE